MHNYGSEIIMEPTALEAIKAKKPIYIAKSLHQMEQRASRELRAAYIPSEREVVLKKRPTQGESVVLTLVQNNDDPTNFSITRGSEIFGSDEVTLSEILSMDSVKQGSQVIYGSSQAANMIREAQGLVVDNPGIDITSIVSKYEKQPENTQDTKFNNENNEVSRPTLRR
jgi:hypothetical protein